MRAMLLQDIQNVQDGHDHRHLAGVVAVTARFAVGVVHTVRHNATSPLTVARPVCGTLRARKRR
ncbi:hypothetical protein ACIRO3_33905 [Streptomyces sp. NPDC102278]|uniref:hypothetical protein n=1 Tax=Streptomyces sp. NPDC102278 TaxID=3366152 RepID=UPI003806BEEE